MSEEHETNRRGFLKSVAFAGSGSMAASEVDSQVERSERTAPAGDEGSPARLKSAEEVSYPRMFKGPSLAMISYPLGGIGAGSIGLGGRGQLRDWEIFNRADKGNSLPYAFPSIWVQAEGSNPTAHVLEARI